MKQSLRNRLKNMVFTTSENYNVGVTFGGSVSKTDTKNVTISDIEGMTSMGIAEKDAINVNLYASAHEGAHVKYSNSEAMVKAMQSARERGADLKKLNTMCQIGEDFRVDTKITEERPGYWDLRNGSIKGVTEKFSDAPSGEKDFDTLKAVSFMTYDKDMSEYPAWKEAVDWEEVRELSEEIMSVARKSATSEELLNGISDLYFKKYHKSGIGSDESSSGSSEESSDGGEGADGTEETGESTSEKVDVSGTSDGSDLGSDTPEDDTSEEDDNETEVTDAEIEAMAEDFSGGSSIDGMLSKELKEKLRRIEKEKKEHEMLKEKYERKTKESFSKLKDIYKFLWTEEEHKRVEEAYCVDVHAGANLAYVERKKPKICRSFTSYSEKQANMLGEELKECLRADRDADGYVSNNGVVQASKCWKAIKVGDDRVFHKPEYEETGNYVVDLLLDASGSQVYRNEEIRIQATIIARACSVAGIPCRVTQFMNRDSITRIERFRDYDDPKEKDLHCLRYDSGGDNRDGLAILGAVHELRKRPEENKIFIVLSDGVPGDASADTKISLYGGLGYYYGDGSRHSGTGRNSIEDTAHIIRSIRKEGIVVMGIYVGEADCALEDEKRIYGNDFAYIRNMDTFVPVVARTLKKLIEAKG